LWRNKIVGLDTLARAWHQPWRILQRVQANHARRRS